MELETIPKRPEHQEPMTADAFLSLIALKLGVAKHTARKRVLALGVQASLYPTRKGWGHRLAYSRAQAAEVIRHFQRNPVKRGPKPKEKQCATTTQTPTENV